LSVEGRVQGRLTFTLDQFLALPTSEATLPMACVEGWSYSARWSGVRVADLLRMAGAAPGATVHVQSLEANSPYRISYLDDDQAHDGDTLLATHLDGQPLALDHGYPLRLIGPGRPGVNQTKWVTKLVVR
jgi:DMSO/TMAO reductase YedYZ molybdopterin-dependent catalytic subunit